MNPKVVEKLDTLFRAPQEDFYVRRIIWWIDEAGDFANDIEGLTLEGVKVVKLTSTNNFTVKKMLEIDDPTGDYLIYSQSVGDEPARPDKSYNVHRSPSVGDDGNRPATDDDWFLDIKNYSLLFRADRVSLDMEELGMDTSSREMRIAMEQNNDFFNNAQRLKGLAQSGIKFTSPKDLHLGIMAVLCGIPGDSIADVIIAVLSASAMDDGSLSVGDDGNRPVSVGTPFMVSAPLTNIEKFGNPDIFWQYVSAFTGYTKSHINPLAKLASHILTIALSYQLPELEILGLPKNVTTEHKTNCYQLIHQWQRGESKTSLQSICERVTHEINLINILKKYSEKNDIISLCKCDTFPCINQYILTHFFTDFAENDLIKHKDIFSAVEAMQHSGWFELTEHYIQCLYYLAKMKEFISAHSGSLDLAKSSEIWTFYTAHGYPMDTYYRYFHYYYAKSLHFGDEELDDALKKCIDKVEGLYSEKYLKKINRCWTSAIATDLLEHGFVKQREIARQRDFYRENIDGKATSDYHIFVVISDALRFEVGAQLADELNKQSKGEANLKSMQATFPTITSFGMASLLPYKDFGIHYRNTNIDITLDGKPTATTEQRAAILQTKDPKSVAILYNTLINLDKEQSRALVKGKNVIYIYHNEIDARGEQIENQVFDACQSAVEQLMSVVRKIVNSMNGTNVIITADHGFLYTYKSIPEHQKLEQDFTGEVYDIDRRYALVAPQTTAEHLLPVKMDTLYSGTPLRGYTPHETIRLKKQGGGVNYTHGGISLQEMVLPVIFYKAKHYGRYEAKTPGLVLISETRKITNLTFYLDFLQEHPVSTKVKACLYTMSFIDENESTISDTQAILADRASDNGQERGFRVRFTLKNLTYDKQKTYNLVIKDDEETTKQIAFKIDMAISGDFGFDL